MFSAHRFSSTDDPRQSSPGVADDPATADRGPVSWEQQNPCRAARTCVPEVEQRGKSEH